MRKLLAALILAVSGSPLSAAVTKEEIKDVLKKNPDIILEVLQENKKAFFDIVQSAAQEEQGRRQKEEEEKEKKQFDEAFRNPLQPSITKNTRVRGPKNAKFTLIEYSDFQCPYCKRGYQNVEALRKKYGSSMRFVYKHMPLNFHPEAMPAAKYMEAIGLQSEETAWKFHDTLFENQDKLGQDLYKKTAQELGVNMERLTKDLESEEVAHRVESDIEEAKRFGFTGTPGFLLNGIPVRGAYPVEHFDAIVARLEGGAGSQPAKKAGAKPDAKSDDQL